MQKQVDSPSRIVITDLSTNLQVAVSDASILVPPISFC